MTRQRLLLACALLLLTSCATDSSTPYVPPPQKAPSPPPAALLGCPAPLPEVPGAKIEVTEPHDAANRELWLQCIVSHNAVLKWIKLIMDEGYTTLPNPL